MGVGEDPLSAQLGQLTACPYPPADSAGME